MLSLSVRQFEYACAIGRYGGLTAAAEALHVSQPALTVALARLEEALGQPLFLRRSGGPMQPTAFGRGWLVEAEAQLENLQRLMAGAVRAAPLRLAVFEDLAPLLLAPLLAAHGTDIAAKVMGFEALTQALTSGQADLALTWDLGMPPTVARHVLARLPPQAVVTADHRLADKHGLTLAEIAREPLVLTDQGLSDSGAATFDLKQQIKDSPLASIQESA